MADEEGLVGLGVFVKGDGEDADLGELLLELDERGELFKARAAPGRPEVDEYDMAAVGGEWLRGHVERGAWLADEAERGIAGVAAGQQGEQDQDGESGEGAHLTSIEVWATEAARGGSA